MILASSRPEELMFALDSWLAVGTARPGDPSAGRAEGTQHVQGTPVPPGPRAQRCYFWVWPSGSSAARLLGLFSEESSWLCSQ